MLLAVDVGNSNISLGIFQNSILRMKAKISVKTRRSADEYAAVLYDLMRMNHIAREEIKGCILASVVPELTGLVEDAARIVTGTQDRASAPASASALTIPPSWEATWRRTLWRR